MKASHIQKLQKAYKEKRLIPFIGAGLSAPFEIPTWGDLIKLVSEEFINNSQLIAEIENDIKVGNYWNAIDILKNNVNDEIIQEQICMIIREKVDSNRNLNSKLHVYNELANMKNIQNYLTTNYDFLLYDCKPTEFVVPKILYENDLNTQLFFDKQRKDRIIWHLHGNIAKHKSIVISKEKYEELYSYEKYLDLFKIFQGVGTLLFIGFSFNDRYIQDLFAKNKRNYNSEHFIILDNPTAEIEIALLEKYKLNVIGYDSKNNTKNAKEIKSILSLIKGDNHKKPKPKPNSSYNASSDELSHNKPQLKSDNYNNTRKEIINNYGNVEKVININNLENLYLSDSLLDYSQKVKHVKKIVGKIIMENIISIDGRINVLSQSFQFDSFKEKLCLVRKKVAPALERIANDGYSRLMTSRICTSLRQAIQSHQLYTPKDLLYNSALDEYSINFDKVNSFLKQVNEVEFSMESMIEYLNDIAINSINVSYDLSFINERVEVYIQGIQLNSNDAYLKGLIALYDLDEIKNQDILREINSLRQLKPNELLNIENIVSLLNDNYHELEKYMVRKREVLEKAKRILDDDLKEYEKLNERLFIDLGDSQFEVIGKAISLRQLGRTDEAVDAFIKYGEMFSEKDNTAELYSKIAVQFTRDFREFGINDGGAYVYGMQDADCLNRYDINVGNIIIKYNNIPVTNSNELSELTRKTFQNNQIDLVLLRMNNNGNLNLHSIFVCGGLLGLFLMNI